ncbi:hypothetical protein [Azospirillum halopraeferens]|uniref:hypothetical protein n=1 Tax=Azospirillum halopraeferens TaxID=34010 RepID=UPI00040BE625|nr:hypothetical protein [Azospirillum halopraeferens]
MNTADGSGTDGPMAGGWQTCDRRFEIGRAGRQRRFAIPQWAGEPLEGKRLFIWREQGAGDEFLSASCYADAIRRAAQVIIECDRRLVPLFSRSFPRAVVRAEQPVRGRPVIEGVECDVHIPAGSLPGLLRPVLPAFPPRSSWLFPDGGRLLDWRIRVDGLADGLRVGIAWRSRFMTPARQWNCVAPEAWGPVLTVPGVTFVNLQHDDCDAEIERAEGRYGTPIYQMCRLDLASDVENTAALVANLDLVIAPANSVAELAGALGVPVWRFGERDRPGRDAGLRYPTMRVFTPRPGACPADALARIARELGRAVALARSAAAAAPAPARRQTAGRRATPGVSKPH